MALKAILEETEFNGLSDDLKKEYSLQNGKYQLDVTAVGGFELRNTENLRSALQKERSKREDFEKKLKDFDGLDVEAARGAMTALEDLKKSKGDELKTALESQTKEIHKKYQKEVETLKTEKDRYSKALQRSMVDDQVMKALGKLPLKEGSTDFILSKMKGDGALKFVDDGQTFGVRVVDPETGMERITQKSDSSGPMGLGEYVESLKDDAAYSLFMRSPNASGSNMDTRTNAATSAGSAGNNPLDSSLPGFNATKAMQHMKANPTQALKDAQALGYSTLKDVSLVPKSKK